MYQILTPIRCMETYKIRTAMRNTVTYPDAPMYGLDKIYLHGGKCR